METLTHLHAPHPSETRSWMALRFALALTFVLAGLSKAFDPQSFTLAIEHYHLTPWDVSVALALYLPWIELAVGLALLFKKLYLGALAITLFLSVLFLAAVASAWWRALDLSCGCFGSSQNHTHYPSHLALNLLLVLVPLLLAWKHFTTNKTALNPGQMQKSPAHTPGSDPLEPL
jgi:putative oxidoreductase